MPPPPEEPPWPFCRVCGESWARCRDFADLLGSVEFRTPTTPPLWCKKSWKASTSKERRTGPNGPVAQCAAVNARPTVAPRGCRKGAKCTPVPSIGRVTRTAADVGRQSAESHSAARMTLPPIVDPPRFRMTLIPSWAALLATPAVARYVSFVYPQTGAIPNCHVSTVYTETNRGCARLLPAWAMLLPTPRAWAELLDSANREDTGIPSV